MMERFDELAAAQGLDAAVVEHDLAVLRADPDHPGEEAPRDALFGASATLAAAEAGAPRICLNGHLDVVPPGDRPWSRSPYSGAIEDGQVHGRGAVDMKGGVVAMLHAVGAVARTAGAAPAEVVVQAVASEEDGGLGTFAALEADSAWDAALIPEPTAFGIAAAQAGALTFTGTVPGVTAHAAVRLEGVSAIDRYVPVHLALAEHERRINDDVGHPLLAARELPYPVLVGRIEAGRWSSQFPGLLTFEGRVGVRVDETVEQARAGNTWTGGQFAPATTDLDDPFVARLGAAAQAELGAPAPLLGVSYGADMRLFCARGIPCVMFGPPGFELAHATDERVRIDDLVTLARTVVRLLLDAA